MSKWQHQKTTGWDWLRHSFIAFNGGGYADRQTPRDFVDSYIDYNKWKKRLQAVQLAEQYQIELLALAQGLIWTSSGPGNMRPSTKAHENFDKFRGKNNTTLL